MNTDSFYLGAAKSKLLRRHFHALLMRRGDPQGLDSADAVIRLICNAGLAAAVNLQRTAAGLKSIGLVRSAEMASDWLAQLPPRRSPAYTGVPYDLLAVIVADEKARGEVLTLLHANGVFGQTMQRLLRESSAELGRILARRITEMEGLAREAIPGLLKALRDDIASLKEDVGRLQDSRGV